MNKFIKILWVIAGVFYLPLYYLSLLLNIIARLFLGISYIGMLNKRMGINVFKSIFKNGRRI